MNQYLVIFNVEQMELLRQAYKTSRDRRLTKFYRCFKLDPIGMFSCTLEEEEIFEALKILEALSVSSEVRTRIIRLGVMQHMEFNRRYKKYLSRPFSRDY